MSIYALKGRFQDLLRPGVRGLYRAGITANMVTLGAALVSLAVAGWVFWRAPAQPGWYALLPVWMLLRMALNAVDGMLAREFGQQSRPGAYYNELSDAIADAALYLSLLSVPGVHATLLWTLAWLAALTEYTGVLGLMVGASRRYDGPMGKSDRAFVIGALGIALAVGWAGARAVDAVVASMALLCALTVVNRVRRGLGEAQARSGA
ncbi:MAG: CDP-alcohol phosphatidyltransferase family protein [Pseudoxanthomonas sp.]|jgi:CDP-diacylglycerol--glycerol-3-phosphate 3-phosphatidyltransferase